MSIEGWAAWRLLAEGAGQWRRAGLDGAVAGLDLSHCLARLAPADGDPATIAEMLIAAEGAAISALNEKRAPPGGGTPG